MKRGVVSITTVGGSTGILTLTLTPARAEVAMVTVRKTASNNLLFIGSPFFPVFKATGNG